MQGEVLHTGDKPLSGFNDFKGQYYMLEIQLRMVSIYSVVN